MNHYIIAPSASQDLNNIADYFLAVNVDAGEKLFQSFNISKSLKIVFHSVPETH